MVGVVKRLFFRENDGRMDTRKEVEEMDERADFNPQKLAELILYISERCKDSPTFGATLLNKILFYSDFLHYGHFGTPITGATYVHMPKGPAPYPGQFLSVRDSLVRKQRLEIKERPAGRWIQKRPVAKDKPNTELFSDSEKSIIDYVVDALSCRTAGSVRDYTHREVPWLLTKEGEEIPYYTVFIREHEPVPMEYLARIQEAATVEGIK
jgi:hypothetical protein